MSGIYEQGFVTVAEVWHGDDGDMEVKEVEIAHAIDSIRISCEVSGEPVHLHFTSARAARVSAILEVLSVVPVESEEA